MNKPATLDEALTIVQERLKQEGKAQYAGLLGREEVVAAIARAAKRYESYCSEKARGYFDSVIKSLLVKITEGGAWPENANLEYFFEIKRGVSCQGFSLGIEIATPDREFKGFSLPILDLWYGWWGEESES